MGGFAVTLFRQACTSGVTTMSKRINVTLPEATIKIIDRMTYSSVSTTAISSLTLPAYANDGLPPFID
jgi:hypothetical protein